MQLNSITPKPDSKYIEPVLLWDIVLAYEMGQQIPLDFTLTLRAGDDRILGIARPSAPGVGDLTLDAASGSTSKSTDQTSTRQAVFAISAKQLDYLEEVRNRHPKRDVVLQCDVEVQYLVSKVVSAYMRPGPKISDERGNKVHSVIYDWQPNPFSSQINNMWVLSGAAGSTFLRCETKRFNKEVVISASDWVHEYLSLWRTTQYVLVELPQPELLTSASSVGERVNAAIEAVDKASKGLGSGDWNDVIAKLRPVWELIRQVDIKQVLVDDGYTAESADSFSGIIKHQFDLASKFAHRVDKSGKKILRELHASKEDAQFCYSSALEALNLITKKSIRQSKPLPLHMEDE